MDFKLKGVELDAFRIYQDKQLFNFLDSSGNVANLVVIFAPNGYGKTSFIDAVEWALTGKINRIHNNNILKNAANEEKGVILKNRKSEREYGTVRLLADNGGMLEKNTKVVGQKNRKTDYADGDIIYESDIFSSIKCTDFSTKSILGQDKIDSFLRSITSKDRFETLASFWDDQNDTELFKKILSITKESENHIKQINVQINEIDKEIESLAIRPNIIDQINKLVKNFNELNIVDLDLSLPILNNQNNLNFVNLLIEFKSKIQLFQAGIEKKISNSNQLLENYDEFTIKSKNLVDLKKDMEEKLIILNNFNKIDERLKSLSFIKDEATGLLNKYKAYKKLLKHFDNYTEVKNKVFDLENLNKKLNKEISMLKNSKIKEGHTLKNLQKELENVKENKKDLEYKFSNLEENFKKTNLIKNRKSHYGKRATKIKELISVRLNYKQEIKKEMLTLESYLKFRIEDIIKIGIDNQRIKLIVSQVNENYKFKTHLEQQILKLEQDYIQFGKLNEQINTVYKVGKKLIEDSNSTKCPLCKKEYEDFRILINNVDRDFIEVNKLNEIRDEIEELKNVLSKREDKLERNTDLFRKEIDRLINEQLEKDIANEAKISSYNSLQVRIKNKLKDLTWEEENLESYFLNLDIDINNGRQIDINKIKSSIEDRINILFTSIKGYLVKISDKVKEQKNRIKEIQQFEVNFESNKNTLRELRDDPVVLTVKQLLEELNVDSELKIIKTEAKKVRDQVISVINKKKEIEKHINSLNKELEMVNKQEALESYEELKNIRKKTQDYVSNYTMKVRGLIASETFDKVELRTVHLKLLSDDSKANSGLSTINELMEFTKYIENNIAAKTKSSQKRELIEQLKIIELGNKDLLNAKRYISKHIETKINNTFNLQSINSIYQRIDPHPDFKDIKFEADLYDKPELKIYASNSDEKISPVLYFSAAQVNILSLSIFLAKALIQEQEGLNTFFMDDPIQYLDNLNILSFIDLLRTITVQLDKQVIISTHNDNFYKLIKRKMDPNFTNSKFIELDSFGKIKVE
ncbi:AAA family ATPase [Bacillus weihaiensis]|uniref:AAA family ATPase n=1 Tax=Bacillus weihaiensis TaxID=1547283 RepID=UPI002355C4BB|nr:AAA family ATPase [Bacillus weihaiensis]